MAERAAAFADPAFSSVLALEEAEAKAMPELFAEGTRLGFRVRLRPVSRTGKPRGVEGARACERDVHDERSVGEGSAMEARARAYLAWLAEHLAGGGARLERGTLESFRVTRLLTRDRSAEPRSRVTAGPDAVVRGTLVVTDPQAFAGSMARGCAGRHPRPRA